MSNDVPSSDTATRYCCPYYCGYIIIITIIIIIINVRVDFATAVFNYRIAMDSFAVPSKSKATEYQRYKDPKTNQNESAKVGWVEELYKRQIEIGRSNEH